MAKNKSAMKYWQLGFRRVAGSYIVCLEGTTAPDNQSIWSSSIVRSFITKGIIETRNTFYTVEGKPRAFHTKRVKRGLNGFAFMSSNGEKVGNVYHFGPKSWFFKGSYYSSLWACQVAADLLDLKRRVKILNAA